MSEGILWTHNIFVQYDVFICHASEDKEAVARPLSAALIDIGVKVWVDELNIGWGDSLSTSIDKGLAQSRFGIVVLSKKFFEKRWPERELSGLVQRQVEEGRTVILPLYHDVTNEDVRQESPTLAAQLAMKWSEGADAIAARFKTTLEKSGSFSPESVTVSIGGASMVERARNLLQDGQHILINHLLSTQTQAVIDAIRGPVFDSNFNGSQQELYEEVQRRIVAYGEVIEELTATLSSVAFYGGPEHGTAVRRSLERLGNEPLHGGNGLGWSDSPLSSLKNYPAVVAFYRTACAAVAAEKWVNLRPLLRDAKVDDRTIGAAQVPMLSRVRPHNVMSSPTDQWLASAGHVVSPPRLTPAADHLAEQVIKSLAWFEIDEHESARTFDVWIFVAQVAYLGLPSTSEWDTCFSTGRWWRVVNTYGDWERTPQAELVRSVQTDGDMSPILGSGAAVNSAKFLELAEKSRVMIKSRSRIF